MSWSEVPPRRSGAWPCSAEPRPHAAPGRATRRKAAPRDRRHSAGVQDRPDVIDPLLEGPHLGDRVGQPVPRRDARVERVQRTGLADRRPARLDERVAGADRALLGDVPVRRWAGPGLAHAWIEAEVADQLGRALEAADVADRSQEARGDDHVYAGHADQPLDLLGAQCGLGDQALDCGDLGVEELDLACRRRPCRAPRAPAPARPATRGSRSSRASAPRPAGRRASRRRITQMLRLGIQTASSEPAANSLASVLASSRSVFALAWRMPHVGRAHDQHPRDVRLDDPRDLPGVARHLPIVRPKLCANNSSSSSVVAIGPQERS
jgi:hypothetical protein